MYGISELSREGMIELLKMLCSNCKLMDWASYRWSKKYIAYRNLREYLEGEENCIYALNYLMDNYEFRNDFSIFTGSKFELKMIKYIIMYFESYVIAEYLMNDNDRDLESMMSFYKYNRMGWEVGELEKHKWKWKYWMWRVGRREGKHASS